MWDAYSVISIDLLLLVSPSFDTPKLPQDPTIKSQQSQSSLSITIRDCKFAISSQWCYCAQLTESNSTDTSITLASQIRQPAFGHQACWMPLGHVRFFTGSRIASTSRRSSSSMPDVDNSSAAATFSSTLYHGNTRRYTRNHHIAILNFCPNKQTEWFSMLTQQSLNIRLWNPTGGLVLERKERGVSSLNKLGFTSHLQGRMHIV